MALFMLLTLIVEIGGRATRHNIYINNELYNFFLITEAGFTMAMYGYLLSKYTKNNKLIWTSAVILSVLYICETSIHIHGIFDFNDITTTVMSVIFIGFGLYYYYLLIKNEEYLELKNYPPFWWVAGTLLFYYGSTAIELFFTIISTQNARLFAYRHITYICLNIIQYGFWSYSFICRYYQRKLTL